MIEQTPYVHYIKVNPTYSVMYKRKLKQAGETSYRSQTLFKSKTDKQVENEQNLRNNDTNGKLSEKATKKLKNAINWLVLSAKKQRIYNTLTKKHYSFKINLITLTIPFEQADVTDNQIKNQLLNTFITFLKSKYDFSMYVWKAEAQTNGNIHFHIASNCFIPHQELKYYWNRLLDKKGYMTKYTEKFNKMSYEQYRDYSHQQGTTDENIIKKRFDYGIKTDWKQPNSTDVHAVEGVKNLAAYLASYMSKKEDGKRPIKGKLWGCSQSLSDSNKCVIELYQGERETVTEELETLSENVKEILTEPNQFGEVRHLATIFLLNVRDILLKSKGELYRAVLNHIHKIRNWEHNAQLSI